MYLPISSPMVLGVDASADIGSANVAGFLPKTAGTISIRNRRAQLIVDAVPVVAGVYLHLGFKLRNDDVTTPETKASVTLGGGASGTLGLG